ncbi:MAG: DnaD domain protein, partial [Lachnospiraceae bacterium]|nr:DnaD domain protein [Lachnospiraceae bacterium]
MSEINLNVTVNTNATIISNAFIERFINDANASHIRFYLYLMYYSKNHRSFSISNACDFLDDSERDVIRSINYWEKQGVFKVTRTDKNTITSISISDPSISDYEASATTPAAGEAKSEEIKAYEINPEEGSANEPLSLFTYEEEEETGCDFDLKQVIAAAGKYAGRTLSGSEIDFICDLNEKLGFSAELISYLYEYCCLTREKSRFSYIQKVALAWAEKNIRTVEAAQIEAETFNKENSLVMKSFGLTRLPGVSEKQYIDRWFHEYKMSEEMVAEACDRALLALNKPSFSYADGVLKKWFAKGINDLHGVAED